MDPSDPNDRKASDNVAFGLFKWEVYHKILQRIFKSLEIPSQQGEAVKCGDGLHRVLFPGVPIHALDGEEAWNTCATRGASADHPCPHCLVHRDELHKVIKSSPNRTVNTMHKVYKQAMKAPTKAIAEDILKTHGLHKVIVCIPSFPRKEVSSDLAPFKNAFWSIANSDPYCAASYDMLHSDDLGKWGKHLWPLTLDILGKLRKKGEYSNKYVRHVHQSQVAHSLHQA